MRTFKWTSEFHVHKESYLVQVWMSRPALPIYLFNKHCLFSIVSSFGKPLYVDEATTSLKRPSVARICVEVDILKSIPNRIWIGVEGEQHGHWQSIVPKNLPNY